MTLDVESADNIKAGGVALKVDGKSITLNGYTIAGNHYFRLDDLAGVIPALQGKEIKSTAFSVNGGSCYKLRDVAAEAGFSVDWDSAAGAVVIKT